MRKILPIFVLLLDIVLIAFSALILLTIVGLSVMAFDAGETTSTWIFFLIVCTVCIGLLSTAVYTGYKSFRKKKYLQSALGSGMPLIAFGGFQSILQIFF
jgi:uncharacterized membrane protein